MDLADDLGIFLGEVEQWAGRQAPTPGIPLGPETQFGQGRLELRESGAPRGGTQPLAPGSPDPLRPGTHLTPPGLGDEVCGEGAGECLVLLRPCARSRPGRVEDRWPPAPGRGRSARGDEAPVDELAEMAAHRVLVGSEELGDLVHPQGPPFIPEGLEDTPHSGAEVHRVRVRGWPRTEPIHLFHEL